MRYEIYYCKLKNKLYVFDTYQMKIDHGDGWEPIWLVPTCYNISKKSLVGWL